MHDPDAYSSVPDTFDGRDLVDVPLPGPDISGRPDPPGPVAGHVWTVLADPDWRVVTGLRPRCRAGAGLHRRACGALAVAEVRRLTSTRHGPTDRWWAYCAAHLYDNWVEDGVVVGWRLVPEEEAAGG